MEQDKEKIRRFLAAQIVNFNLEDGEDMIQLRYLDSMRAMQLVSFVEREFGILINEEELEADNFRSINAVADLIRRKRQGG